MLLFVTFLLAVTLGKLLFTVETGERVHRGKGCTLIFFLFLFTVEGEGGGGVCFFFPYTYDLRITLAVRGAGGCLTTKKAPQCGAVLP